MIFHSLDFVAFFFITVTLYWQLPHRWQNHLLLVASYIFYGWITPWYLLLLMTSTTIDWWAARRMEADPAHKKRYLAFSLASNLGMLAYFKYANFFIDNVGAILTSVGLPTSPHVLKVILPVGISFFTFQALSYTINVYRGTLRARASLLDVATYVAFFPQLVAGPIERASALLPQVEGTRRFSPDAARSGLLLMAWGFFKKLVIADNVGLVADKVFALEAPAFEILWAGVFAFAIQIYADFSAYSDIARGTARWFGFELMVNFDHPYLARGPQDFWRRWHISLSTWFRDYVYIPLGGSRKGFGRELANILATFVLSGFWHGASWNYILWGFYHGMLLVASRISRRVFGEHTCLGRRSRAEASAKPDRRRGEGDWVAVVTPLRIAGMFVLVCIGWLMFRETDTTMLIRDFTLSPATSTPLERQAGYALFLRVLPYAAPLFVQSLWVELWRARGEPARPAIVDGLLVGLLFAAVLVLRSQASLDFIYFQF
jgi:alginate O-acetyltransferase complex protein AlgI